MCADPRTRRPRHTGVTLVELVMYIMVVSIGVAGILSVMTYTTQHSADPMVRAQALLIAESYMREILLKRFLDPSGGTSTVCPVPEGAGRTNYDNVCDYHNLANNGCASAGQGICDQLGNSVTGLEAYSVTVTVSPNRSDPTASVSLGDLTNSYPTNVRLLRVDVSVRYSSDFDVVLTGYRTNYNCSSGGASCLPVL